MTRSTHGVPPRKSHCCLGQILRYVSFRAFPGGPDGRWGAPGRPPAGPAPRRGRPAPDDGAGALVQDGEREGGGGRARGRRGRRRAASARSEGERGGGVLVFRPLAHGNGRAGVRGEDLRAHGNVFRSAHPGNGRNPAH
ncbi:hypothetical protein SLNWT_2200 [Streptomyces albus]|uniref:Uncharacterized protein n=1 Tax=Streptomyces albus (strain ATCC 21838 / DSM 41398 / FERM P-419 / JCM 4703 / NBRC 107858) TaxID=1081613 RepID=A0A0B5EV55_STRA4|nr:hypothetical protein SLNWT_2200 [Streptomyces albus]AOU76890.1 hypothetical protein SLNHY_2199 [Streptomyces albus]AYN32668.1 hypothetical protein DUI70_2165 [Streptomyces albus]